MIGSVSATQMVAARMFDLLRHKFQHAIPYFSTIKAWNYRN